MNSLPSADLATRIVLAHAYEPGNPAVTALLTHPPDERLDMMDSCRLPDKLAARISQLTSGRTVTHTATALLARAETAGARVIIPGDDEWPPGLADLDWLRDGPGEPVCLWVQGPHHLAKAVKKSVAIVGARACTPYGAETARCMSDYFALHGWSIVSGGAIGIDAAAHHAALNVRGATVAVLATGIDGRYPIVNEGLLEHISFTGLLVSEYPVGFMPVRHRFLHRNRLIAAISTALVVAESAVASGSRHAARIATELGGYVAAVPGPVSSSTSAGCHRLIRDGATLVTCARDVITDLTPPEAVNRST